MSRFVFVDYTHKERESMERREKSRLKEPLRLTEARPSLGIECKPRDHLLYLGGQCKSNMCSRLYCMPVFAIDIQNTQEKSRV